MKNVFQTKYNMTREGAGLSPTSSTAHHSFSEYSSSRYMEYTE